MKSKITIEIDFNEGNTPFIQVHNDTGSLDVRDKLITAFRQSLGGSSWCKIVFQPYVDSTNDHFGIYPVTDLKELQKELNDRLVGSQP